MITASIVTYRTDPQELSVVLNCLIRSEVGRIYVVDNSPSDALRKIVSACPPHVEYIYGYGNVGYGAAHNIAIKRAIGCGAEYHAVVNADISFGTGVIEALAAYMDCHADVGQLMPKVLYPNGELQYLCKLIPTPEDLLLRRFFGESTARRRRERFEMRFMGYDREADVPFLSGCFMFLRIDALLRVGLFDERYFMYGEDIDLCRRIHSCFRTVFYPGVTIVHAHQAASYKNLRMLRVHIRNIVRYFNKWGWFLDPERKRVNRRILQNYCRGARVED